MQTQTNAANARSLAIPFAGFYESIHDHQFDMVVEMEAERARDQGREIEDSDVYNAVRWAGVRHDYAKAYAENFGDWVKQETGFDLRLTFEAVQSPREYNFGTDLIFVAVPVEVIDSLFVQTPRPVLKAEIEARHTSGPGFHSSYSNDIGAWLETRVSDWDNVQCETLLRAWLRAKLDIDCDNNEIDEKVIEHGQGHEMAQTAIDGNTDWASIGR